MPKFILVSLIFLSTIMGQSVQAGSSLWSDPEMTGVVNLEFMTSLAEPFSDNESRNSSILLFSGRYEFKESLRAVLDLPVVFMNVPSYEIRVPDPTSPLPLFTKEKTDMYLGNVRIGLEFGEPDDIRTSLGIGLPFFSGSELQRISDDYWIDVMRSHLVQPETMQLDGHVNMWMLREVDKDFQLRSGIRAWIDMQNGEGVKSVFLDVEGLMRLRLGRFQLLAGPSIAIFHDGFLSSIETENVNLRVNLGTNYRPADVPLELGLRLNIQALERESSPSAFLGLSMAYVAN